jgi:hypothetical protein
MHFTGKDFTTAFESAFGFSVKDATAEQLWFLTKFAKHVRMRCRNNTAFNNYMNSNFAPAKFKTVQKIGRDGSPFPGLEITANNKTISDEE